MTDSSIQVVVRVRPLNEKEVSLLAPVDTNKAFQGDGGLAASPSKQSAIAAMRSNYIRNIIAPVDDRMLVFDPIEPDGSASGSGKRAAPSHMQFHGNGRRPRDVRYAFDRVFPSSTQQRDVYRGTVEPMLSGVLSGFNASVFAYGATGCGKTHTISGNAADPGLIFLTMQGLYERIEAERSEYETEVRVSYLEIYNETIRDLLSETPTPAGRGLALREDAARKISVVGITEHTPESPAQVLEMITEGNRRRTQSPTEANAVSSRSHAVLQVNVMRRPRTADTVEEMCSASLNIIDLAGSERASATTNHGMRMKEGANINRSLLALGSCINALCQSGTRGERGRHIPYRNSKLTRLLKFSLGGNCKTVMIACVSPSSAHYDETHNTLKYANQAKNIQTKVSRNLLHIDRHVAQYVQAIASLRAEVAELKEKLAQAPPAVGERDEDMQDARAELMRAAGIAKEQAQAPAYAASLAAKATLDAVKAGLACDDMSDLERAALDGLAKKCQAAEACTLDVPMIPRMGSGALYDAMHAQYAADVRAYVHEQARDAVEHVLHDVVSPRIVALLRYAAKATHTLQSAEGEGVEDARAQGSALLSDMAGIQLADNPAHPPKPRPAPRPSQAQRPSLAPRSNLARPSLASPARLLRKSPRRRILRPTQRVPRRSVAKEAPGMPRSAPAPAPAPAPTAAATTTATAAPMHRLARPSLAPQPRLSVKVEPLPHEAKQTVSKQELPKTETKTEPRAEPPRADAADARPRTRMPVHAVRRVSREGVSTKALHSEPARASPPSSSPPTTSRAAPTQGPARRGLFQRKFLARQQDGDAVLEEASDGLLEFSDDPAYPPLSSPVS